MEGVNTSQEGGWEAGQVSPWGRKQHQFALNAFKSFTRRCSKWFSHLVQAQSVPRISPESGLSFCTQVTAGHGLWILFFPVFRGQIGVYDSLCPHISAGWVFTAGWYVSVGFLLEIFGGFFHRGKNWLFGDIMKYGYGMFPNPWGFPEAICRSFYYTV